MRILLTAGPTREPIDPVRFLSNRSSGKMGYALAQAAVEAGHEVVLVSGPAALARPANLEFVAVETAQQMWMAVKEKIVGAQLAIFAAAVADYTPVQVAMEKIKKSADSMQLELRRTTDILGSMRGIGYTGGLVGFAAETNDLLFHAGEKLKRKGCDLIIANDVSQAGIGFESDDNAVTLLYADGRVDAWQKLAKQELAKKLIGECVKLVK